jgi:glycosyltransferase involved in cell wall biosynthesis
VTTLRPVRVLIASVFSPTPPLGGGEVHLLGLLRALRRLHDVHVVCYGRDVDVEGVEATLIAPPAHAAGWRRRVHVAAGLVGADPPVVKSFASGGIVEATRKLLAGRQFDVVHVTHFEAGFLGRHLVEHPRVYVPIDSWALNWSERTLARHGALRLRDRVQRLAIERFERRSLPTFPVTVVVSEDDRRALQALVPTADVRVIPNGVDSEWFAPVATAPRPRPLVVFHGSLHYEPNVDAVRFLVRDVMPLVRERVGPVDVRLVGRAPVPEVIAVAGPDVEIHADVPDLRRLVAEGTVAVIPLRFGSGVKNKVLEAASLGVATVVTSRAHSGLDLVNGDELLVADDAQGVAEAVVRVLTDAALGDRLAAGGRRAVVDRWSWDVAAEAFTELYQEVVDGATAARPPRTSGAAAASDVR